MTSYSEEECSPRAARGGPAQGGAGAGTAAGRARGQALPPKTAAQVRAPRGQESKAPKGATELPPQTPAAQAPSVCQAAQVEAPAGSAAAAQVKETAAGAARKAAQVGALHAAPAQRPEMSAHAAQGGAPSKCAAQDPAVVQMSPAEFEDKALAEAIWMVRSLVAAAARPRTLQAASKSLTMLLEAQAG